MELDPRLLRPTVEQKSSQRSSKSTSKSPQPPKRPSSSSICVQIPCKHSRYVPGSGPPLQPIQLLPLHDSTAYIKDRILLPSAGRAANGKPLPRRMMYLVGWRDLPAATVLTPAMKVLDYVSPYALEEFEFEFEQEFDDEQIKLEKEKQAEEEEPAATKKRKRERPPVHSQIEAAVVAEPETIAKAKSQPKKGVMSMLSPPRKRLRDFEGLFVDNEEDELSRDYDYDDDDDDGYGGYGDDDETFSNDITPAEQMEKEARNDRHRRHEPDELGMTEVEYPNRMRPWPLMGTLNSGNSSASAKRSTPVASRSRLGSSAAESPRSIPNPSPTLEGTTTQQQTKQQQQHLLYQQSQQNQQQLLQRLLQSQRPLAQQQQQQRQQQQLQQQSQPQNHQRMSPLPPLRYSTAASPRPSQKIELWLPSSSRKDVNEHSAMPSRPMTQPARPAQATHLAQSVQSVQLVQPAQPASIIRSTQLTQPRGSTQSTQSTQPAQSALKPEPAQPALKLEPEPEPKSTSTKPTLPSTSHDDNQWVVERLEDVRYYEDEARGIVRYFLVRWEGDWPADQNPSWEPEENISASLVKQFMRSHKAPQNKRPEAGEAAAKQQKKKQQKQKKEMRQTTMLGWPSARKYSSVTEAFAGDEDSSMGMRSSVGARDSMEGEAERDEFFVVEERGDEAKEEEGVKGWNGVFGLRPWA